MRPLDSHFPDFRVDPWPMYRWHRLEGPVWFADQIGMVCVFSYDAVKHVLGAPDFTVEYPFRISQQVFGRTLLDMDGSDHRRLRRIVTPLFARENVENIRAAIIKPVVERVMHGLRRRTSFDFMSEIAEVVPVEVITRFLGIDAAETALVKERLDVLLHHLDGSRGDFGSVSQVRRDLERQLIAALERADRSTPYKSVIHLTDELTREESLRLMMLLLAGGVETSVCALGLTLHSILTHPEVHAEVSAHPDSIGGAVDEALRWQPPQHDTVRFALQDCVLEGLSVRRGQPLKVILASANRDESYWSDAEAFCPRRAQRSPMTFGSGPHTCLGRLFATTELTAVLSSLFRATSSIVGPVAPARPEGATFRRPSTLPLDVTWRS